ncbi:hypothetical protein CEXT_637911 [Caerostris extrusa]|uniref:Uncharacterized protein n=1 Tax=Caerostris extrusa TaxID=172846 RepID=A0AAV4P704_CAEEX|nr:hypothetical protein CEXT_637911 [Caerostris extrusa]
MGTIEKRNLGGYRQKAVFSEAQYMPVDLLFAYDQERYFIKQVFNLLIGFSFSCMGTIEKRNLGGYRQKAVLSEAQDMPLE